jgi:hypothetical protein
MNNIMNPGSVWVGGGPKKDAVLTPVNLDWDQSHGLIKLKHVEGRIIVAIDIEKKNQHSFEDGTVIRIERKYNNFNRRETEPVNATVVSAENIPEGSEILIHHNSNHETNLIRNYQSLSGKVEADSIRYFSIAENEAFVWHDGKEWKPLPGYDFALRVFRPYNGSLQGIEPEQIKNTLYLTTGEYKGLICHTIKYVDYELVFQDRNNRENRLIRVRTNGDEKTKREEEIVCINHDLTNKLNRGELYVGLSRSDAKPVIQLINY